LNEGFVEEIFNENNNEENITIDNKKNLYFSKYFNIMSKNKGKKI
jgi:hypothetical protein